MEKLLDIGNGLKIARADIDELKEQDKNARSMNVKMFDRLTANIRQDQRLESLPFVAETDRGLEIVSGHHRVRACRAAGIHTIYIILDDTGLDRDSIRSKQLSHNSLQGEDNRQLVKEIYDMIDDAEKKLAAYVDTDFGDLFDSMRTKEVRFDISAKTILVNFMSYEEQTFLRCVQRLNTNCEEMYAVELKTLEPFMKAVKRVNSEYQIRAMNTAFSKMAEIVLERLGEDPEDRHGMVPVRDIFKTAYIPAEAAETISQAIGQAEEDGLAEEGEGWRVLESLCEDYLANG